MERKRGILTIAVLIGLLLILDYPLLDKLTGNFLEEKETSIVQRVIDGDTIVILNDTHVRLLGINTPETKEMYHDEAKSFLENLVLNKTITLEYGKDRKDKYGRTLAYIFLDGKNINLESVRNGFANVYILGDKMHETELRNAWKECIQSNKNLCEKSDNNCARCIELKELNIKSQTAVFYNNCNFSCDLSNWKIKDEGRKNFVFPYFMLEKNKEVMIAVGNRTDSKTILYWEGEDYVWTSTGDTLFLRDDKGKLVLWKEM
jgi:micrococcal nuclease